RLEVSIAHEVPGRVRLRVGNAPPEAIERLAAFIEAEPGVDHARASPASGSIVVTFDPHVTAPQKILDAIALSPPVAWPAPQPAPSPPYVEWVKAGFPPAVMAASITGIVPAPIMLGAVAITAIPPFRRALSNLSHGNINVDVMDATAITVCLVRAEPIT